MNEGPLSITYADAGVDYERIDPAKLVAQHAAAGTAANLARWGMAEVAASRGATAFVWDEGAAYRAFVLECLGTKSLVADAVRPFAGRSFYDALAQDTVAMVANDIAGVGAAPQVVTAYWGVGSSDWFDDLERAEDLARGWAAACQAIGATWGAGETPALGGIVAPGAIDLAGACVGVVSPKKRLVLGETLAAGDAVVLIASSGIHANGLSLARRLAESVPGGYQADVGDGTPFGEALLAPTHLYVELLEAIWASGVDVHYLSNITGHGWRKLMRAPRSLRYRMAAVPDLPPVLAFMVDRAGLSASEAFGTLNMGAGYAVYVPESDAGRVVAVAKAAGFAAWDAGRVEAGPREVVIEPAGVTFSTPG